MDLTQNTPSRMHVTLSWLWRRCTTIMVKNDLVPSVVSYLGVFSASVQNPECGNAFSSQSWIIWIDYIFSELKMYWLCHIIEMNGWMVNGFNVHFSNHSAPKPRNPHGILHRDNIAFLSGYEWQMIYSTSTFSLVQNETIWIIYNF